MDKVFWTPEVGPSGHAALNGKVSTTCNFSILFRQALTPDHFLKTTFS